MELNSIIKKIRKKKILDEVKELVSIPSHFNVYGQEEKISEYIYSKFKKNDFKVDLQEVEAGRNNVIVKIAGEDNDSKKGKSLALIAHMDTVPPGIAMVKPYNTSIINGKIYGRGVADMKGAVGAMMQALFIIKECGVNLKSDLYFIGVVGEETGGVGTNYLIKKGFRPDFAVIGEPTNLNICTSHKGDFELCITIKGKSAHGSIPERGANAILAMAEFIVKVKEHLIPEIKKRIQENTGFPTINFGLIQGGNKVNIVADTCKLEIDRRWIISESIPQIICEFRNILDQICKEDSLLSYEITSMLPIDSYFGPFTISQNHELVVRTKKSLSNMGYIINNISINAWTDAATLMKAEIPTIILGPGDIEQAHTDEEWVEVQQIIKAVIFYLIIIKEFCDWYI
jgi:acetylornithine deacetylase/succinyl-diaminopimelate desuccinylase family protein